ncbi:MAG TPA: twin-arginine translocation signal domain-containing protein [Acidimicrobiia bacterium]|nr:twin-arginine translocation signal domain-containing protein [Acidimicrobiia bacterium]
MGGKAVEITRRDFFKASAAGGAAVAGSFGFDLTPAYAESSQLKISRATEVRSVCPYCAVGCSMIAYRVGDDADNVKPTLVHIEGDPDSPVNGGTLCPKGASTLQLAVNQSRELRPKVRRPGSDKWEDISWDDALDRLARHMKDSRDKKMVLKDSAGFEVNRNEGYGFVGGATITSEEGYLTAKFFRAMGCVYVEQQARV